MAPTADELGRPAADLAVAADLTHVAADLTQTHVAADLADLTHVEPPTPPT